MPRKTIKVLNEEIVVLTAQNIWLKGINTSLITLLKDSGDLVAEVRANLETVSASISSVEEVLGKTLIDIVEAVNEQVKRA